MQNLNPDYILKNSSKVEEINGIAYEILHKKSGAKILFLKNNDIEKSFSITFKTPPFDDTGVFHILEHSVLNGSKKFPVKEPFVKLLKTSMSTYLNAMTFSDKTMFPVSSTNDKDLYNLIDVYMDGILNPLIYENPDIFKQEGWHYVNKNKKARYSGVVYNEMLGVFADPESILYYKGTKALYPNSCYSYDSGGYPNVIPELTYKQFLETHTKYYRLNNCYIIIYGDVNIESILDFLNKKYFSEEPKRQKLLKEKLAIKNNKKIIINANIIDKPIFHETKQVFPKNMQSYAILYSINTQNKFVKSTAVQVLTDVLTGSNESPLKKELLKYNLAEDVSFQYIESMKYPIIFSYFKNTKDLETKNTYLLIKRICKNLLENGIDKKLIIASINRLEFKLKEMDFSYPDGLVHSINSMLGWLYNDKDSVSYIKFNSCITKLKELCTTDYFNKLCEEVFVRNCAIAGIGLKPVKSIKDNHESTKKLKTIDTNLLNKKNKTLIEYTNKIDSPQELATLPQLKIIDLKEPKKNIYSNIEDKSKYILHDHEINTNGILYASLYFDLKHIDFEDISYLALMKTLIGRLKTHNHSSAKIDQIKTEILGDFNLSLNVYNNIYDINKLEFKLDLDFSMLEEKLQDAVSIVSEIVFDTVFEEKEKIKNIIKQIRQRYEQSIIHSGHIYASSLAKAQFLPGAFLAQQYMGQTYYRFLTQLINNLESTETSWKNLFNKFNTLYSKIFNSNNLHISCAGKQKHKHILETEISDKIVSKCKSTESKKLQIPKPIMKNIAVTIPGNVNYESAALNLQQLGEKLNYAYNVVKNAISLDYLWNSIRVKGGAYGAFFSYSNAGTLTFSTYRDPNIKSSFNTIIECSNYLKNISLTSDELEGYIISQVSKIDNPKKPKTIMDNKDALYFSGANADFDSKNRKAALNCTINEFKNLGKILEKHSNNLAFACIGNEKQIKKEIPDFTVEKL